MSALAMETRLTGRHVLIIFLSFFAIVFAVNAVFVYDALSTKPGEEDGASYEAGRHYNAILNEERRQTALAWQHKAQVLPGSRLQIAMTDAQGYPAGGLTVTGMIGRPASNSEDRALAFIEVAPGVYEAPTAALGAGGWVLSFTAQKSAPGREPSLYRMKERLWLSVAR